MLTSENFIGQPQDSTLYLPTLKLLRKRTRRNPKRVVTDLGYRSRKNRNETAKSIESLFMGKSGDVAKEKQANCCSARSATEGFIAVAKNLRGFGLCRYRNLTGHRIWTLLAQTAYNLKKFLQLYDAPEEEISDKSLKILGLLG